MPRLSGLPLRPSPPADSLHPVLKEIFVFQDKVGLLNVQVARASGYSVEHISKIRLGKTAPTLPCFIDLAQTLGFEVILRKLQ